MSRVSSIRSAARGTFSAHRQLPIRWRLAGGSALLTLVILCGFAGAVGGLTSKRIYADFDQQVESAANVLQARVHYSSPVVDARTGRYHLDGLSPDLEQFAPGSGTIIRIVSRDGYEYNSTDKTKTRETLKATVKQP